MKSANINAIYFDLEGKILRVWSVLDLYFQITNQNPSFGDLMQILGDEGFTPSEFLLKGIRGHL